MLTCKKQLSRGTKTLPASNHVRAGTLGEQAVFAEARERLLVGGRAGQRHTTTYSR